MTSALGELLLLLGAICVEPATAQGESATKVSVRVTAVISNNVYLDRGKESGIQPGDPVLLYPPGKEPIQASIVSVSKSSSRCELSAIAPSELVPGTLGEVFVKAPPLPEKGTETKTPEHPPWTHPPVEWDQDKPLLAPAFERSPEEKGSRVYGRFYSNYLHTWDREFSSNEYLFGRLGTDLWVENPFHLGGLFHFDGELSQQEAKIAGAEDDVEGHFRVKRLSYTIGDSRKDPTRMEIGRFLQREFSELGVLDGFEFRTKTEGGDRFGFSLGAMPEPDAAMRSGDDTQVAAFYRFVWGQREDLSLGLAAQKTWHKGDADRDLLLQSLEYHPDSGLFLNATSWVDYYHAGDSIKSHGFELTEFHGSGGFRITPLHGFGFFYDQIRWPELLRDEFGTLLASQVADNKLKRMGAYTWQQLAETVRFDGRADFWSDQNDRGDHEELRVGVRDWLYEQGEVAATLFRTEGSFTSGEGVRLSANRYFGDGGVDGSYEIARYDLLGDPETTVQQAVHAGLDWSWPSQWSANLFTDYRFGDDQDSLSVGVFLQKRF